MTIAQRLQGRLLCGFIALLAASSCAASGAANHGGTFDLVINSGRVIDPASGSDAVRSLGIRDGKIAAISATPLTGDTTIDASGEIVGPGFIDLHAHGDTLLSGRLQAFDGVTTAIEGEAGRLPVADAYNKALINGRATNYGWSASWAVARMQVLSGVVPDGTGASLERGIIAGGWQHAATPAQQDAILKLVAEGLDQGAIGIGLLNGYAPAVAHEEIYQLSRLAARNNVPIMSHLRYWGKADPQGDIAATQEIIANATTTGAHWYICHISLATIDRAHEMIRAAQDKGAHIDVEALVSETGSTFLGAEFLSPEQLPHFSRGFAPSDILYYGQPIADDQQLRQLRAKNPTALIFLLHRDAENNLEHRATQRKSFDFPGTVLASDGMPWTTRKGAAIAGATWPLPGDAWAHPRSHATFTRFLELWVREWREFTLMDAFRLGAYNPARALEDEVPAMKAKGRIEVGADADLLVFKLADISVQATLQNPLPKTRGMRYVIVNGIPVIREGELDLEAKPGLPVRRY